VIVDHVYGDPSAFSGIPLLIATFFYAFQIYCDFSGYTDIAIGTAKILGYDLTENFRQPYFAKTVSEFWRRWHITLSNWFRDYVFFPLERKRKRSNISMQYVNILIVFFLTGMWHGSTVNFLIWGGLHGIFIVGTILVQNLWNRISPIDDQPKTQSWMSGLQILLTFLLVSFAWIFFRADTISDALIIVRRIFTDIQLDTGYGMNLGGAFEISIIVASLSILILVDFLRERGKSLELLFSRPIFVRWFVYYALFFSILLFGKLNVTEFIYAGF
jgi:D-alanyl-lipoteichoic acid acyltransferase DltB (MBOAT superfamily)